MQQQKDLITILEPAACYLQSLVQEGTVLRLRLKASGCVGYAYELERVATPGQADLCVRQNGVALWLDAMAVLYLAGTTIGYHETGLESGLVFNNPNVQNACGCGASFSF